MPQGGVDGLEETLDAPPFAIEHQPVLHQGSVKGLRLVVQTRPDGAQSHAEAPEQVDAEQEENVGRPKGAIAAVQVVGGDEPDGLVVANAPGRDPGEGGHVADEQTAWLRHAP